MRKRWILIIVILIALVIATDAAIYWLPSPPVAESAAPVSVVSNPLNPIPATSTSPVVIKTSIIVTAADNGKTISLNKGDRFTLELGVLQDWTVGVGNQDIIRRLPNFAMIQDAQGIYEALAAGSTTLSAIGRPVCDPGTACPMYVIEFKVNVIVLDK